MQVQPIFRDRREAGRVLGNQLRTEILDSEPVILALPRGGVPIGFEVARQLNADLDIFLVRKLGVPGQEELAMGAIGSGGVRVLNHALIQYMAIPDAVIESVTEREQTEIGHRERLYREGRPALPVAGRTVILVDDGLATGATMLAAARALRLQCPERIVVAVPVASVESCGELRQHVDQIVCAATPDPFYAVGIWYEDFAQTTEDEVRELLERAARERVA